eukprot:TRINITY_DN9385_c0_g1_i1.p1 TRINITY_DN9385_c0_g1~~TRINITY_DN9385_c0_g1_i1.p1  ORF type:complete len:499 (+),score=135.38 TRINITY_DN9385_c0_g1_i1:2396-3892(+)
MVRFDPSLLRYLDEEDFRVLAAVELASRNHELAPAMLVEKIAGLKAGGARKRLRWLLKHNFLMHECKFYDGYRMNYMAYDYLAMRTFVKRKSMDAVGNKVGVGKESDIYCVRNEDGRELILKIQRLGRTSFRTVKNNRDYKNGRALRGESWFYISRLAAMKEFSFMKALHAEGFPVPEPIDQNRHCIVMSKVDGYPLRSVAELRHPQKVFKNAIDLIIKFAKYGLIHGDFNEFNLMITDEEELVVIDFPQMTSTNHPNATMLFNRDVKCVHDFFRRKFKIDFEYIPELHVDTERQESLDKQVMATGYNKKDEAVLDVLLETNAVQNEAEPDVSDSESDSDSDDSTVDGKGEKEISTEDAPCLSAETLAELSIAEKPKENDDGRHEDDEDSESSYDSEKERQRKKELRAKKKEMAATASVASTRRIKKKSNANVSVSESGESIVNVEHVKARVKGILRREDYSQVVKSCKKNSQKPGDKRRTKSDINTAKRDLRAENYY